MLKNIKQFGPATVGVVALLIWLTTMLYADGPRYGVRPEIRQEIRLPEHRTDTARAIDAYERTMDRYMWLTERNLGGMNSDIKVVLAKLESIDSRMNELSRRIGKIEEALGIKTISRNEQAKGVGAEVKANKSERKVETVTSEGRK